VGRVHLALGNRVAVGVPPRAADQRDTYAGALRGLLQSAPEVRIQMTRGQRSGTPGSGLFQQQPRPRGGGGPREGLVQVPGDLRARTHGGKPNLSCLERLSGPSEVRVPTVAEVAAGLWFPHRTLPGSRSGGRRVAAQVSEGLVEQPSRLGF
jgi:hypothetical protein